MVLVTDEVVDLLLVGVVVVGVVAFPFVLAGDGVTSKLYCAKPVVSAIANAVVTVIFFIVFVFLGVCNYVATDFYFHECTMKAILNGIVASQINCFFQVGGW
jgi:hypothetical protein